MKRFFLSAILATSLALGSTAFSAVVGTDNGGSWTTATWTNGAHGSIGTWWLATNGLSSSAIADSTQGGRTSIGSSAFQLIPSIYSDPNQGYMNAYLVLDGGALSVGQALSFDLNYNWNNGIKGFSLQTAGGATNIFTVQQNWGDPLTAFGGGLVGTNEIFPSAYQQAFTLEAHQYDGSILLNVLNNGTNIFSETYTTTDQIAQIRFFAGNVDTNQPTSVTNNSIFVNNIAIVPEPSTYALLALGSLGLGGYILRRRR